MMCVACGALVVLPPGGAAQLVPAGMSSNSATAMQRLKACAVTCFELSAIPLPGGVMQSSPAGQDRITVALLASLPLLTGEFNRPGACAARLASRVTGITAAGGNKGVRE